MRLGRLILTVTLLIVIAIFPLLGRDALLAITSPSVHAASSGGLDPAGRAYRDNDNDDNDNRDDNDGGDDNDNGGGDNDNDDVECFVSLNSNEEVPCDFEENDNGGRARRPSRPEESVNRPTKCFDAREVGVVQLGTGAYDVTVTVMPHSSFGQTTRLTLRALDPASVSAVPGTLVDGVVFALDAQSDCSGAAIGTLPNPVNLGITYNVVSPVDKGRLQVARLEGSSWVNVDTVADPIAGNPYVSTTIGTTGTYALFQR